MPDNNHCPIIYLRYPGYDQNYNIHKGCFEGSHIERNAKFDKHFWWFENCGEEDDLPTMCSLDNETNNVVCADRLMISHGMPQLWFVSVGYICGEEEILDFQYNMSFKYRPSETCKSFKENNTFHQRCMIFNYTHYSRVNIFGWQEKDIQLIMSTLIDTLYNALCYQHILELACRTFFPECNSTTNTVVRTPCRQMCLDVLEGCAELTKQGIVTNCSPFADTMEPDICLFKPVFCELPLPPLHGGIKHAVENVTSQGIVARSNLTFYCDPGFTPADDINVTCQLSGRWSKPGPTCTFNWEHNVRKWLPLLSLPIALILVLIISIKYYQTNELVVQCIIRHSAVVKYFLRRCRRNTDIDRPHKYHAFISYNQHSMEEALFVRQKIVAKIPNGTFFTHDEVLPGQVEVSVIEEALLSDCDAFIILLTKENLQLPETKVYFQIAQTRHSAESTFQFIVINFDTNIENSEFESFINFGLRWKFVHNIYFKDMLFESMIKTMLDLDME